MVRSVALVRILVVAVVMPLLAAQSSTLGVAAQSKERVIVVLRDDVADPAAVAQELGRAHGLAASQVYRTVLKGFAAGVLGGGSSAVLNTSGRGSGLVKPAWLGITTSGSVCASMTASSGTIPLW